MCPPYLFLLSTTGGNCDLGSTTTATGIPPPTAGDPAGDVCFELVKAEGNTPWVVAAGCLLADS